MKSDDVYATAKILEQNPDLLSAAERLEKQIPKKEKLDEAAEGAQILDDLVTFIKRFVRLDMCQATVIAVWIVHTHCFAAADFTPYLWISSPEKRSGKTRVLEVARLVVAKPWMTGAISAAALKRKTHAEQPTLLLDETDTMFSDKDEYSETLRGVLNSGYQRDGSTTCCEKNGNNWKVIEFKTFCPKVFAGLSRLPDTITDRSIPIRIKRKLQNERVERFHFRKVKPDGEQLRNRITSWAKVHIKELQKAEPALPDELNDRQQDVAEPLLAIADACADGWPERFRTALVELCSARIADDESKGAILLTDIAQIFKDTGLDRLPSQVLCAELAQIETSPWSEWVQQSKPISPKSLATQLKRFEIKPRVLNLGGDDRQRGYFRCWFPELWRRYCPTVDPELIELASRDDDPDKTSSRQEDLFASAAAACNGSEDGTATERLRVSSSIDAAGNTCTDQTGGIGEGRRKKQVEL